MTDIPTESDNVVPEGELERRRFVAGEIERLRTAIGLSVHGFLALESAGVPVASWLPILFAGMPEPFAERFGSDTKYGVAMIEAAAAIFRGKEVFEIFPKILGVVFGPDHPAAPMVAGMAAHLLGKRGEGGVRLPPRMSIEGEHELRNLMESDKDPVPLDDTFKTDRMRATIARLLEEAPKLMLPNGKPDPSQSPALQCHVVLNASIPPIEGVLSTTPEGGLRLMTPHQVDGERTPDMHPRAPAPQKTVMLEQFFDYADVVSICVQREIKAEPGSGLIS
jgi:hypothetical protein